MRKIILYLLMKRFYVTVVVIFFIGCSHQKTIYISDSKERDIISSQEMYLNHPVKISLNENKKLLSQLENKTISEDQYDSLLSSLGRVGEKYLPVEHLLCSMENDSLYREIIRAEYFMFNDSLLHEVDEHLQNLILYDSTIAINYIYLGLLKSIQNDTVECINLLNKAKIFTQSFDNSWLYFAVAYFYENNGQLLKAVDEYKSGFEINPDLLLENWDNLFDLYIKISQYDKAEELFHKIENISNDNDFRRNNWYELVKLYWVKNDLSKATTICIEARDSSNYISTTKELTFISIKKNDYESAQNYLWDLSSIKIISYPFSSNFNFAQFDSWDNHYSQSLDKLRSEIKSLSKNKSACFCLGYFLISQEMNQWDSDKKDELNIQIGLTYLKNATLDNSNLNFIIGYILNVLDEKQEAITYYKKVLNVSDYYPYALINLSVLLKPQEIDKSLPLLLEASDLLPDNMDIIEELGDMYYINKNDYPNAINWYEKLITVENDNYLKSIWLANSYLQNDEIDKSQSQISSTIDNLLIDENTLSKYWYLGMAYKIKGDISQKLEKWEQSLRDYENSIKYNPQDMEPRLSLASVYYKLDDYMSAENIYLTVIDSIIVKKNIDYNTYRDVLNILSVHYLIFDKDPYKLSKIFEKATDYFPESDWCYRLLGFAYSNQEDYNKAILNLNKAIEIAPNNSFNYSTLAETYEKQGTFDKSIENYRLAIRVLEKENQNIKISNNIENYQTNLKSIGEYHSKIANLYKENIEYDQAVIEYQKAISITPDTIGIVYRFDLASAYFLNKEFNEAIVNWNLVYDKNGDINSLFNIALSYLNIGGTDNLKKSKNHFIDLIKQTSDNMDYIDLKLKSEHFIEIIDNDLNRIEWPELLNNLSNSKSGVISECAKLFQLIDQYNDINNLFIDGNKESSPNKEYLEYSKEWIITSYSVSPKIFQSESLCDRFKITLANLNISSSKLIEVKNLWLSAAVSRKEGIAEYSKGYYLKKKDYSGEWERGLAKINVSDQYFVDGLVILNSVMEENIESFSNYGINIIKNNVEYYSKNK